MKGIIVVLSLLVVLAGLLVGCGGAAQQPAGGSSTGGSSTGGSPAVALKITGNVEKEMAWTEDEVKAMDTIEAESTNKDGETKSYTGVSINTLLEKAGVKDSATALVFVADDDYTAEAALAEVQVCANCIVSFRNQGGFSTVLPDFSGKLQVKDVVEIQVK